MGEAENDRIDAQHKSELQQFEERKASLIAEQEKVAAVKREKIAADAKVSDEKRVTFSKERQDSLEEKIEIERKDFEMKKYIQTTLTAAHTERNNVAGLVQKQVESLAGAAENVAETIHYIHQNRVDGLNKGVTKNFDAADALLKQEIQKVDDKFVRANEVTMEAVDRNKVRAHALAQDIVDRHGAPNFRKAEVCKTFIEEANKEDKESAPGKWQKPSYFTTTQLFGDDSYRCTICKDIGSEKTEDGKCPKDNCGGDWRDDKKAKNAYIAEKFIIDDRRRLASMTPSEQALERRRLASRPKSHIVVLEQLLEEINRLN